MTGARVVVVGAGGVIGSHLVPHLARSENIGTLILIDFGDYEVENLASQDALPQDVGRPKAEVQADRARRIRRDLRVISIVADVEALPVGWLEADLVLTCVDSRRARQHVNFVTRRLGIPWIDAGVLGSQLLVRIDVIIPDPDSDDPCLECRWSDADYAALEQRYPCGPDASLTAPTGSPSSLGALAAALQAIECGKQLAGDASALATGEQVVIDALGQTLRRTAHRRRPQCRLVDHARWETERLRDGADELTLGSLFERAREAISAAPAAPADDGSSLGGVDDSLELRIEPQRFETSWICEGCGRTDRTVRLVGRARSRGLPCPSCAETLHATGIGTVDFLRESQLTETELALPLGALGIEPGDVVTVIGIGRAVHFALAGKADHLRSPWNVRERPSGRDTLEGLVGDPNAAGTEEGESQHVA